MPPYSAHGFSPTPGRNGTSVTSGTDIALSPCTRNDNLTRADLLPEQQFSLCPPSSSSGRAGRSIWPGLSRKGGELYV